MRKVATQVLEQFNNSLGQEVSLCLSELDEFIDSFEELRQDSREECLQHLADEVFLTNISIACVAFLTLEALRERQNKLFDSSFPANNTHLIGNLTFIANTGICVSRLCQEGFDTQARILLRSLSESIYQTLIVFSSAEDFEQHLKAETPEESKVVWYQLFAKRRLYKKLAQVELQVGFPREYTQPMIQWRENNEKFYSQSVHHASVAAYIGAWASSFDSDRWEPALLGNASAASRSTMSVLNHEMLYFVLLMHKVLVKFHQWKPSVRSELTYYYLATLAVVREAFMILLRQDA